MTEGTFLCLDPDTGGAHENTDTAVQSSLPDMVHGGDHPAAILDRIWAGKPNDATVVTASKSPEGVFTNTPIKTITAAVAICLRASDRGLDAYHAPAFYQAESHTGADGKPRCRTAENASGASCWWGDVDVGLDKDAKGDGYATLEGAWHAVECFCTKVGIIPPNIVVVSGGGLHVYWTTGRFVPKRTWVRVARKLKQLFKQHGLRADPHRTADIASVLRPTGTVNHKIAGYRRPVFAIRIDPHVAILTFVKSILDASQNLDVAATHQQRIPPSLPIQVADPFAAYKGGMGRDWNETPANIALVDSLLAVLSPDRSYNGDAIQGQAAWLQLGFALAYLEQVWGWECARGLFDHWSQSCPDRYNCGKVSGRAAIDQLFASYDPLRPDHHRTTIATLIKAAQDEGGWVWPEPDRTADPAAALAAARTRAGATQATLDRLKGTLILPSDHFNYDQAATNIFQAIAPTLKWFYRNGVLVEWSDQAGLVILTPEMFVSRLDKFGVVLKHKAGKSGAFLAEARCGVETAKILMASEAARRYLPHLAIVSANPVLTPQGAVLGHGYHPEQGGVLVTGTTIIPQVPLATAVAALVTLLVDFNFVTAGDRARAIAAIISPALAIGGMLPHPPGVDYAEADQSQAGKGYRHELVRAIYGIVGKVLAKRQGGVGSLDEDLSAALLAGELFIVIDNVRGTINSAFLESILTNTGLQNVRVPHRPQVDVDAKRVSFQISSNGMEATPDLANRVSVCRILKQPSGYRYHAWPEGSLIDHVRAQQAFYLGCVYAIVGEWISQGRPGLPCQHDRKAWAEPLNWIVQTLFGCGDLMAGHEAAKRQFGDPATSWLRQLALRLQADDRLGEVYTTQELAEVAIAEDLRIPGAQDWGDRNPLVLARRVGALMKAVFQGSAVTSHPDPTNGTTDHQIVIDRIHVGRAQVRDYTVVNTGAHTGKRVAKTIPVYAFGPVQV